MKAAVPTAEAGTGILASVMLLVFDRNQYALLALRQILRQNFALDALEVVIVDDGTEPISPLITSELGEEVVLVGVDEAPPSPDGAARRLVVRLLRLEQRATIGEKRNLGRPEVRCSRS